MSPNNNLFKAGASNRSIAVHTHNSFEKILAGWDPRYGTPDVP